MARKLEVEITGDASGLQRAFGQAGKSSSGLGRALGNLGKVAAVGVGAAFVGLAAVVKRGFGEIAEGQQVMAQTRAGLKSTGGVANVTAKEIENLATSISNMTGIDDEAVQASENMLLTFAKVRNEVGKGNDIFDQATLAVGDMATRMNDGAVPSMEQLSQTSIRVGKALNDPIKGMGALGRVGVQFDEGQKKLITSMVKAGDTMGAQKLILAELTKEFGGSAKAAGDTMPGQLAKLSNSFDNVSAKVAEILLPYLMRLVQWTNDHMPEIEAVITKTLNAIVATIDFLVPIISSLIAWFRKVSEAAKTYWPQVQAVIETVINWFKTNIVPTVAAVIGALIALWKRFGDEIMAVVGPAFKIVFTIISSTMLAIKAIIQTVMALIRGDWGKAWDGIKTLVSVTLGAIKTVIVTALTGLIPAVLNLSLQIGRAVVSGLARGLAALVSEGLAQLRKLPGILSGIAGQAAGWAFGIGQAIVTGILNGVGGLYGALKSKLEGTLKSVLSSLNPFSSVEHGGEIHIGKPIVDGAIKGVNDNAAKLKEALTDKVQAAVEGAKSAVQAAKGVLGTAFGDLMGDALSAFDAKASLIETRTERLLRMMDEATKKADLKGAISQAQKDLAAAQAAFATVTPQAGEDDAAFNQRIGEASQKILAAQKTLDDALAAQTRFRLEQQALKERKALEDRLALRRKHFEDDLLSLQNYANNHALTAENLNLRLIAIFKKYNVPFRKSANELGLALAEGLNDSIASVAAAAQAVRDAILKYLSHIQVRINIDVTAPDRPDGRQHGGPVKRGSAYIVGEAGPELFVPSSSGRIMANGSGGGTTALGGGPVIQLVFNGPTVGTGREFEDTVRRALYDVSRRNPRLAI